MERLTYITEKGEVLFHLKDSSSDKKITILQLIDGGWIDKIEEIATRLGNYEDAEGKGLLLRLPCKVGDVVWDNGFGRPCA